jgi:hypothetical protein
MVETEKLQIPIIKLPQSSIVVVFKPVDNNPQGGIDLSLNRSLELIKFDGCSSDKFRFVPYFATSRHTEGGQLVLWIDSNPINKKGVDRVNPWQPENWNDLYNDPFLDRVQNFIPTLQKENPALRAYMYLGVNKPIERNPNFRDPHQSQIRPHMHISEAIELYHHGNRLFKLDEDSVKDQEHFQKMADLLNFAGERAIQDHRDLFRGFGNQFKYKQLIGTANRNLTLERTMFSFEGEDALRTAIKKSRDLQSEILPGWMEYITKLKQNTVRFNGVDIPLTQSILPNMAVILRSEQDRLNGKVDNNDPVWVLPLSTAGALVLAKGGVISDRATPYDPR